MRRTTKEFLYVAVAIAAALLPGAVVATADEAPAAKPKAAYSVWTANCARTLQLSAACDSVRAACFKAYQLRREMTNEVPTHAHVIVVVGEPDFGQMLDLFGHLSSGRELKQPHQFEVYRPGCRMAWTKVDLGTEGDLAKAEAMTKEGTVYTRVEVIYNLSPAPAPVEAQALAD